MLKDLEVHVEKWYKNILLKEQNTEEFRHYLFCVSFLILNSISLENFEKEFEQLVIEVRQGKKTQEDFSRFFDYARIFVKQTYEKTNELVKSICSAVPEYELHKIGRKWNNENVYRIIFKKGTFEIPPYKGSLKETKLEFRSSQKITRKKFLGKTYKTMSELVDKIHDVNFATYESYQPLVSKTLNLLFQK